MSRTLVDLKAHTEEFFKRHWVEDVLGKRPDTLQWSDPYVFTGPIPNGEKQGVYAFLAEGKILYIGVGASRNDGRYRGAGLGARIRSNYMRLQEGGRSIPEDDRPYRPVEAWKTIEQIVTIGFEMEHSYLAYALEAYLIARLNPPRNTNKPGQ